MPNITPVPSRKSQAIGETEERLTALTFLLRFGFG